MVLGFQLEWSDAIKWSEYNPTLRTWQISTEGDKVASIEGSSGSDIEDTITVGW